MKPCSIAEKRAFTVGYMKVTKTSAILHSPCTDVNLGVCNFRIFVNAFLADSEETAVCELHLRKDPLGPLRMRSEMLITWFSAKTACQPSGSLHLVEFLL